MDSNMYLVMRHYWSTNPDEERWDDTDVAAMSVDAANRFVQGWKCPYGDYEPLEEKTKYDSYGCMWRFFKGVGATRMTMRIDRVPLI